ncbi:hypothetical protein NL676_015304 [Syzygium grande]|nr:hypothetical protein NL676_015304 [Syzygium grande]
MVSMLREAEGVAVKTIESLLTLVHTKLSRSFFSKLMHSNRVAADERASNSELEIMDVALYALLTHNNGRASNIQIEHVQAELESHIQDLEEEIESLIRRLIRT